MRKKARTPNRNTKRKNKLSQSAERLTDNKHFDAKKHPQSNKGRYTFRRIDYYFPPTPKINTKAGTMEINKEPLKDSKIDKKICERYVPSYKEILLDKEECDDDDSKMSAQDITDATLISKINTKIKCVNPSSNNEKTKDKSKRIGHSSKRKYGICIPSYEEILQDKKNCDNYNELVQHMAASIIPLPEHKGYESEDEECAISVRNCKHVPLKELKSSFWENRKYLNDISEGNVFCKRHEFFKKSKFKNNLTYNSSMILFTKEQKQLLVRLLCEEFGDTTSLCEYYFKVLLPELCLKIFMDEYDMSYQEASQYLDSYAYEI